MKAEYEALAKANENSWRILFSIANVFSYNEYFKEAIQMWQKTFDCMPKPRYTDSFEAMAQCCVRMRDHESAVEYYKKELELLREDWGLKYGAEVDALEEKIRALQ